MAKLEEIASNLDIDIKSSGFKKKQATIGKKRRAWLPENAKKSLESCKKSPTGFINPIDKPDLSIGFINPIDKPDYKKSKKRFINPIDQSGLIDLENLRGNPLKIIKLICGLVENRKEKITEKFTLNEIAYKLNISRDSAKTAIKFLVKNNILLRKDFRSGKNGWSRYIVEEFIYDKIIQIGFINPVLKGSNSSSSIYNTTTIRPDKKSEQEDVIDISLSKKIGLTKNHLAQLLNISSPKTIQESINHFIYDLENNEKHKEIKKTPLSYFMGIMKRNGCYNAPDNYESPQDKAMREWVEKGEKQKKIREEQREKIFDLAFNEWLDSMTEEEAKNLYDKNSCSRIAFKGKKEGGITRAVLWNYYRENIWVKERKEKGLEGWWDHFNDDEINANETS